MNATLIELIKTSDKSGEGAGIQTTLLHRGKRWYVSVCLLLCLLLAACRHTTDEPEIPVAVPERFSNSGQVYPPQAWWTAFAEPQLDAAIDDAMAGNLELRQAWYRLRASQAIVEREEAQLLPTLDGVAEAERLRTDDGETSDSLQLGLAAAYEIDLWGRIRATVAAEDYRKAATRADLAATAIALSAETATTWLRMRDAAARVALLRQQVQANERLLELLRNRLRTGQSRSVDVLRQQQLLAGTRRQLEAGRAEWGVYRHQLAVLQGRPPEPGETVPSAPPPLPPLPPLPTTGIPLELVQRRPDVQAALERLRAADQDTAAAVSAQYPRLNLTASLTTLESDAVNLFETWALSVAGNLLAPLIDGGRREAEVRRAAAVKQRLLLAYGQTVLVAFQEVEDALLLEQRQQAQLRQIEEQVQVAEEAYEQLQLSYVNGVSGFIDVLTAETDLQQLQRDLLSARRLLLEYRVSLYRALAGDLQPPEPDADDLSAPPEPAPQPDPEDDG